MINNVMKSVIILICGVITLTSCGNTDEKSNGHSQTDSSSVILANDSSSCEENIIYEYKSTEELLENEKTRL